LRAQDAGTRSVLQTCNGACDADKQIAHHDLGEIQMVIVRRNSGNSSFDNKSNDENEVVQRKIFKTWHEVMAYMQIETVELPWNADGVTTLRILRDHYGKRFKSLSDPFLDEVVDAYSTRSTSEQLAALGEAMQELKLRFCHLNLNPPQYTVFAVESDNTRDYLNKWKEVLTRRQFFNMIDTFAMRREESLDKPAEDVRIPMSSLQVLGVQDTGYGREYILDKKYLVVTYETVERYTPEPIKNLRIYDLRTWPLRELKVNLSFDRENIEPFSLEISTESGEVCHYVGDDILRARSWKKTYLNEKNEYLPVYDEAYDEDDGKWHGLSLGKQPNAAIPVIEDAVPIFTIDDCIIYYYDNDDVDNRQPEENNSTRAALQKRRERRKQRNTLIEYNTKTKKYRTLELPASAYINADELILYKNTWIIIPDSIFNRDAAYILRLWNPRTQECLRLTQRDMGSHNIERIIPTENGDILILLDDGRLCRFDVDLVDWLKQDLLQHKVVLDDWQNEVKRGYDNFPDDADRFVRLRRRSASDRMLITFEDGKTYDILLKEDNR
jgi:adenylate kinase family enzyme